MSENTIGLPDVNVRSDAADETTPLTIDHKHDCIRDYIKRGLSIIPVKSGSKEAAVNWKAYQQVRATEDEVWDWFINNPRWNIGIVTGPVSGIVGIDVDGEIGHKQLESIGDLPITPRVSTARGVH